MHTFSGPERKGKRRKAWMRQQNPEAVEIAIQGNKEQNLFFSFSVIFLFPGSDTALD